jgi:L-lactate dehydrogenase complex protein LldG
VWVTDENLIHRAVLFLAEHLILLIDRRNIVNNLHEAYQRIEVGRHPFAGFISGPSKTADIEQTLVMGAQGPRMHTVYVVTS